MQNLVIEETKSVYLTPGVNFDANTGKCWITGESYLEHTTEFYGPLEEWIKTYTKKARKAIELNLKLDYFNTSSQRSIL